jgi:hypothetical protein
MASTMGHKSSTLRLLAAVCLAGGLALSACSNDATGDDSKGPSPTTPATVTLPSPRSSQPANSDEAVVLEQYRAFFTGLPQASRLDEERQTAWLRRYVTQPALREVAGTLASQRAHGKVLYGEPRLRPGKVAIKARTATVRDCQDTSGSGVQDAKTGRKDTKGLPRTLVITTLKEVDETWKISSIRYQGPKC